MSELTCNKIEQILQEIRTEFTQSTLGPGYIELQRKPDYKEQLSFIKIINSNVKQFA